MTTALQLMKSRKFFADKILKGGECISDYKIYVLHKCCESTDSVNNLPQYEPA